MPTISRVTRARLGAAVLAAVLCLTAGVLPALARPALIHDWMASTLQALRPGTAPSPDTVVVFGPRRAVTPNGALTTTAELFAVAAADQGRRYLLKIENGAADGSARVTGEGVLLSGTPVVTAAELTAIPRGGALFKPVMLQAENNALVAAVRGPAGAYLTLSVVAAPDPTFTIWGVKSYERAKGTPVTVTERITVPRGAGAPYLLYVQNGDGARRSSAASVRLNGLEIVGAADLNQTVAGFVKPVALTAGDNVLEVRLLGAPGSRLALRIAATDADAPVLTVTAPAPGLITKARDIAVVGTVADQTPTRVTANGIAAALQGSANGSVGFTATVPLTDEGSNTITVSAVDAAGHRTDSVRTVIRDTEAPNVSITSLPDTATISTDSSTLVNGTVIDRTKVTALLNGAAVVIDSATGRFSQRVRLTIGMNFLTLVATDAAGNATTVVRQVTRDAAPPTLTVTAPADSQVTRDASVHVTGTATAPTAVTVMVNGATVPLAADGSFSADVALVEGRNAIAVVAATSATARTTVARTVIRDTQAPAVEVASPTEGLITKDPTVTLTGTVTDATATTLTMNGAPLAHSAAGAFTVTVPLTEGAAELLLVATDAAGNRSTVTRHVVRDATPPAITVQNPAADAYSQTTSYEVSGSVNDATAVTITVNGVAAPVAADGGFASTITLADGPNSVTIVATDAAGNRAEATASVTLDAAPPALALSSPTSELTITRTPGLVVAGSAADRSGATVTVNGIPVMLDGTGAFTTEVTLAEGANTITVMATDGAGNMVTAQRQVTLDTQPPELSVIAPAEGAVIPDGGVSVMGSVHDASTVAVTANGIVLTVGADGSFAGAIDFPSALSVTIVATDGAGNATTIARAVRRPEGGHDATLPPDPATVAPAFSAAGGSSVSATTAFLYSGPNPIQTGVAPGTIVPSRVAVVNGRLTDRDGRPVSGVTVTVKDHPELGQTLSREDGRYDLAVNGGGVLTLDFARTGYLAAQRMATAEWERFTPMEDVVLLRLDPQVTTVSLDAGAAMQVARGSVTTDDRGTRQATLMFDEGTSATLTMPDGTTRPLSALSVRATEYTAGAQGPRAMPAALPPTSAYTYAVELSVDEAIAAGATHVQFTKPVPLYVDNFLAFPTGSAVPVGYYDREKGAWVPEDDGVVIAIVGVTGGLADIDADGDGVADDAAALAALGFSDAERTHLAQLYAPGKTLWRALMPHFSPIDLNMPPKWPKDAKDPDGKKPKDDKKDDNADCKSGSIISCQNQSLGERVELGGTPYALSYQSNRMPGYAAGRHLSIPLSGPTVPASLRYIVVEIVVAGQVHSDTLAAQPNQTYEFDWDGKDSYGRAVNGAAAAKVAVGFAYPVQYAVAKRGCTDGRSFGTVPPDNCSVTWSVGDTTRMTPKWKHYEFVLGGREPHLDGLGGWTLSVHHRYDPANRELLLGDGSRRGAPILRGAAGRSTSVITTVAGNGKECYWRDTDCGPEQVDGRNATDVKLQTQGPTAVGPDGTVYFAGWEESFVLKIVAGEKVVRRVTGSMDWSEGGDGDGGPAVNAKLGCVEDLDVGPDGNLYIADGCDGRVRKVNTRTGIITTVAGNGDYARTGDGGLATEAGIGYLWGVDVGKDGSIYIAQYDNNIPSAIRRVAPDGRISTIAGGRDYQLGGACARDEVDARSACLDALWKVREAPDGSLLVLEDRRLRRITTDGRMETVAGDPDGTVRYSGTPLVDGEPTVGTDLATCGWFMDVGRDGSAYISDWCNPSIRRISPDHIATTTAGNGNYGYNIAPVEGQLATREYIYAYAGPAVAPDGSIYIGDYNNRVFQVSSPLPGTPRGDVELVVAADDGTELYHFDGSGRHLRTTDVLTGRTEVSFGYDAAGYLTSLTDNNGQTTTLERNAAGVVQTVTGPYGERTTLAMGDDGLLASATNAAGETVRFSYGATGLLSTMTDPGGKLHQFGYDGAGRLIRDEGPGGNVRTLARVDTGSVTEVTVTDVAGRATVYRTEELDNGQVRRTETAPDGTSTTTLLAVDGSSTMTRSTGDVATSTSAPDPRFGMQAQVVSQSELVTPGGLRMGMRSTRTVVRPDPNDPLFISQQIDSTIVNGGRASTTTFDVATRTRTTVSPEGRQTVEVYDEAGRLIETRIPEVLPVRRTYDANGRLFATTQGPRSSHYTYDAAGRVASMTDALGNETSYEYDAVGRVTVERGAMGREYRHSYDVNGNETSFVVPGGRSRARSFTDAGLPGSVRTVDPDGNVIDEATADFNPDGRTNRITHLDGTTTVAGYDAAGRAHRLTTPAGVLSVEYDAAGREAARRAPNGTAVTYGYDGQLLTSVTLSGAVAGAVQMSFDNDFHVASRSVNGADPVAYTYDRDGLLTSAGGLQLTRSAATGLLTAATLGGASNTWSYDSLGDLAEHLMSRAGQGLYGVAFTRDVAGRISSMTETVQGTASTIGYTYDPAGRLIEVRRDGVTSATYAYDERGNRKRVTTAAGVAASEYDVRDRLVSSDGASYTYTPNGQLSRITVGSAVTQLGYDVNGMLQSATLPDGRVVEYVLDPTGRRVGKKINGVLVQGMLYVGSLDPVAELDASGAVRSRFVYGTRTNVPDYMVRDGVTYHIVTDHLGSVRLVVNETSGAVVQRIDYDEFGRVTRNTNPGFQPFGFAGGLQDEDTKLVHFGVREYDPATARWISQDPVGYAGGSANLYAYVGNDPVNALDPSGLSPCPDCDGEPLLRGLDADVEYKINKTATGEPANAVFAPEFAEELSEVFRQLNYQGITPEINSGYRTQADQDRMRNGGSGSNPAAQGTSPHQVGVGVDINGSKSSNFEAIKKEMKANGLDWGGDFPTKADPPHFEDNPYGKKYGKGTAKYKKNIDAAADLIEKYFHECMKR